MPGDHALVATVTLSGQALTTLTISMPGHANLMPGYVRSPPVQAVTPSKTAVSNDRARPHAQREFPDAVDPQQPVDQCRAKGRDVAQQVDPSGDMTTGSVDGGSGERGARR